MKPARPAATDGSIQPISGVAIASIAVPGPANACSRLMMLHALKIVSSPFRVPTLSINCPAGICPIIIPRLNATAM